MQGQKQENLYNWKNLIIKNSSQIADVLNPPNSKFQGVDFAESLLVWECRYVLPQTVEGVVDTLHPPPLPHVGRVPHLHL